jgi:beta-aspartyl-peptidase (threonine type)
MHRRQWIIIGLWLLVVGFVLLVPMLGNWPGAAHQAAGPAEIRRLLDAQVQAWNEGNLEGFMAGYWKSEELEFLSGSTLTHGWQATLDRYRQRYQAEGQEMGTLTFSAITIRMIDSEQARVQGRWHLALKKGPAAGSFTLTFRRFDDDWRITRDETTLDP